jgi:hypothetical protein
MIKDGAKENLVVNSNNLINSKCKKNNFFELDSIYHENAPTFIVPSSICKIDQRKGAFSGLFIVSCCDQC